MAKCKKASPCEMLAEARLTVSDLQYRARGLVSDLALTVEELDCAAELHIIAGRTSHAARCSRLADGLRQRIDSIRRFGGQTIDEAISYANIPF